MSQPLRELPRQIHVGDSFQLEVVDGRFDPGDGWAMELRFAGGALVNLTGAVQGGGFLFTAATNAFGADMVGGADWTLIASKAAPTAERCVAGTGRVEFLANPILTEAPGVQTTHAERMLAAITAVLEQRATTDQKSYTIDGRTLERLDPMQLTAWRGVYERKVRTESLLAAKGLERAPMKIRSVLP